MLNVSQHSTQKYIPNELPWCIKQNVKMLEENMNMFMTIRVSLESS